MRCGGSGKDGVGGSFVPTYIWAGWNGLHFQFLITSLLKFFVRSRRDWKEKMLGRIPTYTYILYMGVSCTNVTYFLKSPDCSNKNLRKILIHVYWRRILSFIIVLLCTRRKLHIGPVSRKYNYTFTLPNPTPHPLLQLPSAETSPCYRVFSLDKNK